MKLGPVTKIGKRNTETLKKMAMTSCRQILTSLPFFRVEANLKKSGNRIPNAWSVKLTFSLTTTFYLTKTEKRTKKSLTQHSYCGFE